MKRRVIWDLPAVEQLLLLARIDREAAARVLATVKRYGAEGSGDIKKLQGRAGDWRLRSGDWRVILGSAPELNAVHIMAILNRRDAYD